MMDWPQQLGQARANADWWKKKRCEEAERRARAWRNGWFVAVAFLTYFAVRNVFG